MKASGSRRRFVAGMLGFGGSAALGTAAARRAPAESGSVNVRDAGAAGDGMRYDGKAIQDAIDTCAAAGGGTVYFPAGTYLTGTLFLKSRITLHLEAGAILLGSKRLEHYPRTIPALRSYTDNYTEKSLLYGEGLEDIGIQGHGTVKGQGAAFQGPYKVRPYLMRLIDCRRVSVSGVKLADSPMWVLHCLGCEDVNIRGITIRSRVNHNNDGIDVDCCRRVRISDCDIWSGDDAIVLKSTSAHPTTDVTITNCVLSSDCNALKMGTESNGGFQNIAISNCAVYDTRLAGLALEIVDGGVMDRVSISGIVMKNVTAPIFVRLGNRARPFEEGGTKPGVGRMRNVSISDIQATGAGKTGCAISGIPGRPIEDLSLRGIRLEFPGGGVPGDATREIPENENQYPEHNMFGTLPAYGLYCRHVRNLALSELDIRCVQQEARPALTCDDVEKLRLFGSEMTSPAGGSPVIRLHQTRDAFIHGCRSGEGPGAFVAVSGAKSRGITIAGNDLAKAGRAIEVGPEVPSNAVDARWNR